MGSTILPSDSELIHILHKELWIIVDKQGMGIYSALIFLVFLHSGPSPQAAPRCEVKNLSDSQYIGPIRKQDGTGLCYAFTGVALIQEKYCRTRAAQGKPCRFDLEEDDRLSVLDATALANYGQGGIVSGGYTHEVIQAVDRAAGLAPESCAPFDQMINRLWDRRSVVPEWRKAFTSAHEAVQSGACSRDTERELAQSLKQLMQLQTTVEDVVYSLRLKDASIALKGLVLPRDCERKRVPLPALKEKHERFSSPEKYLTRVRELVMGGRSAGITLCAFPSGSDCGNHALTVRGAREYCCDGKCRWEYRIQDSSTAFSQKELGNEGWVSESVLLPRLDRYIKSPDNVKGTLTWIE